MTVKDNYQGTLKTTLRLHDMKTKLIPSPIHIKHPKICHGVRRMSWLYRSDLNVASGKRLHNRHGKSPFLIGKSSINGPCSIAMLNYPRVIIIYGLVGSLMMDASHRQVYTSTFVSKTPIYEFVIVCQPMRFGHVSQIFNQIIPFYHHKLKSLCFHS